MTARVLVVDDLAPNVKLLEAKLRAEYFEVVSALSGREAIEIAQEQSPDIILLDVMMPGLDGFETCQILKADPKTCHIPVVMVTALDQQADRLAGLEAGADDFLTKPVQDLALFARVRNLTRLKQMTDELRHRHAKGTELGVLAMPDFAEHERHDHRILVISDDEFVDGLVESDDLGSSVAFDFKSDARAALDEIRDNAPDLIMVDLSLEHYDPLRLCSAIRSFEGSRLLPLLALSRESEMRRLVRALDIGVNDYLMRPIDTQEMAARVKTQLKRKWYIEHLRSSVSESLEMAVIDPLTNLYNRRYLASQLPRLFSEAVNKSEALSLMVLDVDHFKRVNDELGHDVGDLVLKEIASRLSLSVRVIDLACRYGGEEFVFVMPETDHHGAQIIADRLRAEIADSPIRLEDGRELNITVSIGVSTFDVLNAELTPQKLLKTADEALYTAKAEGRNRVVARAA
jgi:two-component system cell cycle response regulator